MEQRISLITLGVADLSRSRAFYEALGWRGQEVQETVFFQAGGLALVLWGRAKLAADSGVPDRPADGSFDGIALADAAERVGGTITRPPAETSYGGYAACFADPDGHIWEIAHNPGFALAEDGTLQLPDFG